MNTKILEFILLVQEMRLAQKQCLRSKNQDLVVRRLQLEIDVDVALHSIAKEGK